MKCLNCGAELEADDNFCPVCGHWTAHGYSYFNNSENVKKLMNGYEVRQSGKLSILISLVFFLIVLFIGMLVFRGNNLFKPIIYIKKQIDSYHYGYHTSIMKTDNIYNKVAVNDLNEAYDLIRRDFDSQTWKCMHDIETYKLEEAIETDYNITSVNFCDIKYEEVAKIKAVIDEVYSLFPNVDDGLTNITITNTKSQADYIAYFQPMFEFVNPGEDINIYNRVNKTQILLNSYYFLNDDILARDVSSTIGNGFYVDDVTWESTIAHEFGHYITFKLFLKENNIDSITFVDVNNEQMINDYMKMYDSGVFSKGIVDTAIDNYNQKYNMSVEPTEYASAISKYASITNQDGEIIFDETIAEAIHDYYLHGEDCNAQSYEIVSVILNRL